MVKFLKQTTSCDKLWSFHGLALALHAQALLDGIVATTWDERTRLVRSVGVENPWRKPVQYVQCTTTTTATATATTPTPPTTTHKQWQFCPLRFFFPISMTGEWD